MVSGSGTLYDFEHRRTGPFEQKVKNLLGTVHN